MPAIPMGVGARKGARAVLPSRKGARGAEVGVRIDGQVCEGGSWMRGGGRGAQVSTGAKAAWGQVPIQAERSLARLGNLRRGLLRRPKHGTTRPLQTSGDLGPATSSWRVMADLARTSAFSRRMGPVPGRALWPTGWAGLGQCLAQGLPYGPAYRGVCTTTLDPPALRTLRTGRQRIGGLGLHRADPGRGLSGDPSARTAPSPAPFAAAAPCTGRTGVPPREPACWLFARSCTFSHCPSAWSSSCSSSWSFFRRPASSKSLVLGFLLAGGIRAAEEETNGRNSGVAAAPWVLRCALQPLRSWASLFAARAVRVFSRRASGKLRRGARTSFPGSSSRATSRGGAGEASPPPPQCTPSFRPGPGGVGVKRTGVWPKKPEGVSRPGVGVAAMAGVVLALRETGGRRAPPAAVPPV
mmetsp:Transcript_96824/g.166954  ORF Transcript_96824/g.166954 Transcript_96824/m.166954 type:complete len:412 (-) Transcript_96824:3888-5123(-)